MLTWEDDLEVHALRRRGWTISAIARHSGFDRKTVRKYLAGDGEPGVRACDHLSWPQLGRFSSRILAPSGR